MIRNDERRPGGTGAASKVLQETGSTVPHRPDIPHVAGTVYSGHPGRRRAIVLVDTCPYCESTHLHRAERVSGYLRRGCLVFGRPYLVFPRVIRRRAVVRRVA